MNFTVTFHYTSQPIIDEILRNSQMPFRWIPSKTCVKKIPGLTSYSFRLLNDVEKYAIEDLFANEPVWIKYSLSSSARADASFSCNIISVSNLAFGYMETPMMFLHEPATNSSYPLTWVTNSGWKCIFIQWEIRNKTTELRLDQNCLDHYFLVLKRYPREWTMIIPLRERPRCSQGRSSPFKMFNNPTLSFGHISKTTLSNCSALLLRFPDLFSFTAAMDCLTNLMKLDMHYGPIEYRPMKSMDRRINSHLSDFWSSYAYQAVLSLGYQITHRLHSQLQERISSDSRQYQKDRFPNHRCYLKLMAVYISARHNRFFDIQTEYDAVLPLPSTTLLPSWCYVPRVYLTPYGIYPMMVKPIRGNRVIREQKLFGPNEHFCRVLLRNVDFTEPHKTFIHSNEQWILNIILGKEKLFIGNKKFEFLLSSNSQLSDRSFWFYAQYKNQKALDIRRWLGDFSEEKCIGKYVARMALAFSGTTGTFRLEENQMELIDDKVDKKGRMFTDGAGKISRQALQKALEIYNADLVHDDKMPSAIQIRLNGIKGILTYAPDLDDRGILIQYRQSQLKFKSQHNVLEIVQHCIANPADLNRQVILLLENMGVPHHQFLHFQNHVRLELSKSLLDDETAQRTLEQKTQCFDWKRMREAGISLTGEPFIRNLLLLIIGERLKQMKQRTRIPLSLSHARVLMGVVDETDSLEYGQVFIQLRQLDGLPQILKSRQVIITKNPAHFPGDVRVLTAVDCPSLYHLYDCIVFPSKGMRPHPNEISGSDTDGDEFWVCWHEDLVQSVMIQYRAAEFDTAGKKIHEGEINMTEIAKFIMEYLATNDLGILANRHLAISSLHSPNDKNARQLAELIATAVDFPKTGILPSIPTDIPRHQYPDFMEKEACKQLKSKNALGVMYRQICEVYEIHRESMNNGHTDLTDSIDQRFFVQDFEDFEEQARIDYQYYAMRMHSILAMYNLTNEYELITSCHSNPLEEKRNNHSIETASFDFQLLIKEMRTKFNQENLSAGRQMKKASAWYYVAYSQKTFLSFGWLMDSLMCSIAEQRRRSSIENRLCQKIGQALIRKNYADLIIQINDGDVKIGENVLNFLQQKQLSVVDQKRADRFLTFIHQVGLGIFEDKFCTRS